MGAWSCIGVGMPAGTHVKESKTWSVIKNLRRILKEHAPGKSFAFGKVYGHFFAAFAVRTGWQVRQLDTSVGAKIWEGKINFGLF